MELLRIAVVITVSASTARNQLSGAVLGDLKTRETCPVCPACKARDYFSCYSVFSSRKGKVNIMTKDFFIKQSDYPKLFSEILLLPGFMNFCLLCQHLLQVLEWQSELAAEVIFFHEEFV